MSRFFYTLLFYLGLPLIALRLLYRAWKAPAYAKRWNERFGFFPTLPTDRKSIWIHTVSVGESIAAAPLVRKLMASCPDHHIVVTTMTPTGSEQVKKLYGDSVFHVYAPYDLPDAISRFLNKIQPELAIFMETELWPNTVAACHNRNIPTLLTNARLSERSARGYQRVGAIARSMLKKLSFIAAQSEDDAQRFVELGFPKGRLQVTGTLKFDIAVSDKMKSEGAALRKEWLAERPEHARILVAASTHKGEDELVLEAFNSIRSALPETLLVLVPRHPERFDSAHELLKEAGLNVCCRSRGCRVTADTDVLLGDTMGELMKIYAASDVTFIGGSLVEHGGHNPLEPAAFGLPVISGPHVFNFVEVVKTLKDAGAMTTVHTSAGLARQAEFLLADHDACVQIGQKALQVMDKNRGALDQQLMLAMALLEQ